MARTLPTLLALALLAVPLSGCLGIDFGPKDTEPVPPPPPGAPWISAGYQKVRNIVNNMTCQVPSVSPTATSANLRLVGSTSAIAASATTYGEVDVKGNFSVQARYNAKGFYRYNITDPTLPRLQGTFTLPVVTNLLNPTDSPSEATYDVKFTKEGSNILVGFSDRIVITYQLNENFVTFNSARGTLKHPADYNGQAHMIATHVIGDAEYVFAVPSISGQGLLVAKIVGVGVAGSLNLVKVHRMTSGGVPPQSLAPHDLFIVDEWIQGEKRVHAYLANGFNGIVVLNVDDPSQPGTVASAPPGVGDNTQQTAPTYYHSIQMAMIGGRRIVATSAEVGYNTVKVWDFTDFKKPQLLGQWVYDAQNPTLLQHNIQIVNNTLFVAHYGQGVFGFDLVKFLNNTKAGLDAAMVLHWQPETPAGQVWDILVQDGILYLGDMTQGLKVVAYGCFQPGDRKLTSRG